MALTKNYSKENRYISTLHPTDSITKFIEFLDAYIKITKITGGKDKIKMDVVIYNKEQSKEIDTLKYLFTPSVEEGSENFIKQGYEYLKTLDEFKDAKDC